MSPAQLAVGYVLHKQPGFIPLVGARTVTQLEDAWGALDKTLSAADVEKLEAIARISGDRYAPEQMKALDSEQRV